jgi:hypothetical protein
MIRGFSSYAWLSALLAGEALLLSGCGAGAGNEQEVAASGVVQVPLTAVSGEHSYRVSNALLVVEPGSIWLQGGNNPNEKFLTATLPSGSYTAELVDWSLERDAGGGRFEPVEATLRSSATVAFTLLNQTTTTVQFEFETDGQIVTSASGNLRVAAVVNETPPVCTILGAGCEDGSWCAPSELTGAPLACVAAGTVAVGELCASPLECVANSSCFDLNGEARCSALCERAQFGESCPSGGTCQARGADYGVCVSEAVPGGCPLNAESLAIPDPTDVVYDGKRCRVYVATAGGTLFSHDLRTQETSALLDLPSSLRGMDISPSEDLLLVADSSYEGDWFSGTNGVYLLDLALGTATNIRFGRDFYEGGTYMPLFIDDENALVSSQFLGSGWAPLRAVHLSDGSATVLATLRQDTMLSASADRSTVAYAEANISSGSFGRYRPADGSFEGSGTGWFAYEIATDRAGAQYAVPSYGGLFVYDESFNLLATLGEYAEKPPLGVAYSPVSDVLYASFASFSGSGSIEAIDSRSFETLYTVDSDVDLSWGGNGAFGSGRLRISADGKRLFATVPGGVEIYVVGSP